MLLDTKQMILCIKLISILLTTSALILVSDTDLDLSLDGPNRLPRPIPRWSAGSAGPRQRTLRVSAAARRGAAAYGVAS